MFEVQFEKEIPLDLYEELLTGVPSDGPSIPVTGGRDTFVASSAEASGGTKVYCEFCKGYYYEEYHFGDQDE